MIGKPNPIGKRVVIFSEEKQQFLDGYDGDSAYTWSWDFPTAWRMSPNDAKKRLEMVKIETPDAIIQEIN